MAEIINGIQVASEIKNSISVQVKELETSGKEVGLAVVIVGDNPASRVYVNNKKKDCEEVGIKSFEYALPENITQKELLDLIEKLNNDSSVNGILVQLPIPKHLSEKEILNAISPKKDVDAFHPVNVGKIMIGDFNFLPCTPAGVMELLRYGGIEISGKNCVVIGRSNIVGKPMAMLLLHEHATVTICHSRTANLAEITNKADILVAAVGKANFVTADMVKDDAVVIDVGMNKNIHGKLCGDVDFEGVFPKAKYITPVPGGVGPMTRAMLLKNTVTAKLLQEE